MFPRSKSIILSEVLKLFNYLVRYDMKKLLLFFFFCNLNALELETERLTILTPELDDAPEILDFHTRNKAYFAPWGTLKPDDYYTLDFWLNRIELFNQGSIAGESLHLYMREKINPLRIIGEIMVFDIKRANFQSCCLGYKLDQQYVGFGYMSEALTCVIDYLFNELKLNRIWAFYMPENRRSAQLLKRLSFDFGGYIRNFIKIQGVWEDHMIAYRLNENA